MELTGYETPLEIQHQKLVAELQARFIIETGESATVVTNSVGTRPKSTIVLTDYDYKPSELLEIVEKTLRESADAYCTPYSRKITGNRYFHLVGLHAIREAVYRITLNRIGVRDAWGVIVESTS